MNSGASQYFCDQCWFKLRRQIKSNVPILKYAPATFEISLYDTTANLPTVHDKQFNNGAESDVPPSLWNTMRVYYSQFVNVVGVWSAKKYLYHC